MADFPWPTDLVPFAMDFYLQPHSGGSESPFTRQTKTYGLSAPRWRCRMTLKAPWNEQMDAEPHLLQEWQGRISAEVTKYKGREHRALVWDFRRAQLGSTLVNEAITPGDVGVLLSGGVPKVGGYIGGDGRPHKIIAVTTAGPETYHITVEPPFRDYVAAGAAEFERVAARFMLASDEAAQNFSTIGELGTFDLEFVEDLEWTDERALASLTDEGFLYDTTNPAHLFRTTNMAASVTAAGQATGRWRDLSGNDNDATQDTSSERPIWEVGDDGLGGAEFDGTNDFMDILTSLYSASGAMTFIAAVQVEPLTTTSNVAQHIYGEAHLTNSGIYTVSTFFGRTNDQDTDNPAKLRFGYRTDAAVSAGLNTKEAFADGQIRIITARDNGNVLELWIDNRKELATLTRTGTITLTNAAIGANPDSGPDSFLKGRVLRAAGFKRALTDAQISRLQKSFAARVKVPERSVDGGRTQPNQPSIANFHGHRLIGSVTHTSGIRVTDTEWDGDFRGRAYSPWSMGAIAGDTHSAPSTLALADGRLFMAWTGHNASLLYGRVTKGPSIDGNEWETTRAIRHEINTDLREFTYVGLCETWAGVYLFTRARLVTVETSANRSIWYARNLDPQSTWPAGAKLVNGTEAYILHAQNGPNRIDFQVTLGNPALTSNIAVYHFYMLVSGSGVETFHKSDGTVVTLPLDASKMTVVHSGSPHSGWIGDIAIGPDGHPRMVYPVFNNGAINADFVHARWDGSAWVVNTIADFGGPTVVGVMQANGAPAFDPDDTNIIYTGRKTAASPVHQIWRYETADGLSPVGEQVTNEPLTSSHPVLYRGMAEPRLTFMTGDYEGVDGGEIRIKLVHSLTAEPV